MKKAAKKALKEKRRQDDSVRIRMTKDQHDFMERAAEHSGNSTLSAWARPVLLKAAREELGEP